jgi:molybdopterin adenylyltransferase
MNPTLAPGGRIDERAALTPVRVAVLTISDTRDEESDTSGHLLAERVSGAGHELADRAIVADDIEAIRAQIKTWTASGRIDAIVSTGGTGLTGRDVTPEAIEPLFDKRIEGFSVAFHLVSYQSVGLSTLQSRGPAGMV